MATNKLNIYNGALLICGDRQLAALTESREPRFLLDLVWDDGGVRTCLEAAQWYFAMRASRLDYNPALAPDWGFNRGYTKPTDWVLTSGIWQDEFMQSPLTMYADEVGYWFTNVDEIFVKYVSDDVNYGMDFAKWPGTFTDYVKAYFASRIIRKLPGGTDKVADICDDKKGVLHKALVLAKNKAAMTQPTTFPSRGTWVQARFAGRRLQNFDGGNPNSLTG